MKTETHPRGQPAVASTTIARPWLAAALAAATLSGCATAGTYALRKPIRDRPTLLAVTIPVGLIATGALGWKLLDSDSTFDGTIFVPLTLAVDLVGSMGVAINQ